MAYLYCKEHGEDKKHHEYGKNAKYDDGEYTKIAYGTLISDFVCDKCNCPIIKGQQAYLFQFCPETYIDQVEYDYFKNPKIEIYPEKYKQLFETDDESLSIKKIDDIEHYFTGS